MKNIVRLSPGKKSRAVLQVLTGQKSALGFVASLRSVNPCSRAERSSSLPHSPAISFFTTLKKSKRAVDSVSLTET